MQPFEAIPIRTTGPRDSERHPLLVPHRERSCRVLTGGAMKKNIRKSSSIVAIAKPQLLAAIGSYWQVLAGIGSYWPLLAAIGRYWQLLAAIGSYWKLLTAIDSYWQLLVLSRKTIFAACRTRKLVTPTVTM